MEALLRAMPLLLARLREQRLAFFIGAGVPASEAALPSGNKLRSALLSELGESEDSSEDLPKVASRFETERDRNRLFDLVKETLQFHGNIDDQDVCPSYKVIRRLPVKTLLTTNYDDLIEGVFARGNSDLRVYRQDRQLANFRHDERKLLKIHGDLTLAPDEIVLTSEDYARYLERCPLFCDRSADIFQDHTIVFLGYSLEDPNFRHLYDEVIKRVTNLKMKSFAVQRSEPSRAIRDLWLSRRVEIIAGDSRRFLSQLHKEYRRENRYVPVNGQSVKLVQGRALQRPEFLGSSSPSASRKAFAYFVARQKSLLMRAEYDFCVIDTLQNSAESLDPGRKIAREISNSILEVAETLTTKGFNPRVLPPVDEMSLKARAHRIESADFCIVIIGTLSYEASLNKLYGPSANRKPIILFVHDNLRVRLKEDLVFAGLVHTGADVELFTRKDLLSGQISKALYEILEKRKNEWLIRVINHAAALDQDARVRLTRLLSFDCLLVLTLMQKHRRVNQADLCRIIGVSAPELMGLLGEMESLGAIKRARESFEMRPNGRKILSALELYKFDASDPATAYVPLQGDLGKTRSLGINQIYVPKDLEFEGV